MRLWMQPFKRERKREIDGLKILMNTHYQFLNYVALFTILPLSHPIFIIIIKKVDHISQFFFFNVNYVSNVQNFWQCQILLMGGDIFFFPSLFYLFLIVFDLGRDCLIKVEFFSDGWEKERI